MENESRIPQRLIKKAVRLPSGELAWTLKGARHAIHLMNEMQSAVTAGVVWQQSGDGCFSKSIPEFSWDIQSGFRAGEESWNAYCTRCRAYSFYAIEALEELPETVKDSLRFQLQIKHEK